MPRTDMTVWSCVPAGIFTRTLRAVGSRNHHTCAQCRLRDVDRNVDEHIGAVALEVRVVLDARGYEQVACSAAVFARRALALEAQATSVDRTRRNLHRKRFGIRATGDEEPSRAFPCRQTLPLNVTFRVTFMSWPLRGRG